MNLLHNIRSDVIESYSTKLDIRLTDKMKITLNWIRKHNNEAHVNKS
jgi:hypothetical protein